MSDQSSLVSLLGPDQDTSLHSLLQSLECQARIVHEKVGEMETQDAPLSIILCVPLPHIELSRRVLMAVSPARPRQP